MVLVFDYDGPKPRLREHARENLLEGSGAKRLPEPARHVPTVGDTNVV